MVLISVRIFNTGFASSDSAPTLDDPAERQAMDALEEGTRHLEEGNVEAARDHYKRSVGIQKSAAALFNLGVSSAFRDSDVILGIDIGPSSIGYRIPFA